MWYKKKINVFQNIEFLLNLIIIIKYISYFMGYKLFSIMFVILKTPPFIYEFKYYVNVSIFTYKKFWENNSINYLLVLILNIITFFYETYLNFYL